MEVKLIIERLHGLAKNLGEKMQLEQQLDLLQIKLQHEKTRPIQKLDHFDSTHKAQFIHEKVGEKPTKPTRVLAIVFPIYRKKKKEYAVALEKYNADIQVAEKEYLATFEHERQALTEADNKERETAIQDYTLSIESTEIKLSLLNSQIQNEDIVGASVKNLLDIQQLIGIFDDKRADTIKEAVNVLFDDKHRKKMEELQAEHVRLTKEAKEAAERAVKYAEEAIQVAREALDRADEAYYKAQDAYSEAQDAYSEATRHS